MTLLEDARRVIEDALPDASLRRTILRRLVRSVEVANSIAPNAWSATLYENGFCLNVGHVEVLRLRAGWLRLNLCGQLGTKPFVGRNFEPATYSSQPQPHCAFVVIPEQFASHGNAIANSHEKFVSIAARKRNGEPFAGTRFKSSHCPALLEYATAFLERGAEDALSWSPTEELSIQVVYREGATRSVLVNAYERNRQAREHCLAAHGKQCAVCRFDFEAAYGTVGRGYIHVHHLEQLSLRGYEYELDAVRDLRPVCANCHAIIHRRNPPYTIEEVTAMLSGNR